MNTTNETAYPANWNQLLSHQQEQELSTSLNDAVEVADFLCQIKMYVKKDF